VWLARDYGWRVLMLGWIALVMGRGIEMHQVGIITMGLLA